ncbi:hypothetical protein QQF64_023886, partial [Cirrhinus molitorella]
RSAQTAVEDSERIFTELIHSFKRRCSKLIQLIRDQEKAASFQSLSASSESTDVNDDLFSSLFPCDVLREAVHQLRDKLEDFCKKELKKISDRVTFTNIVPRTRKDFLQ